MKKRFCPATCPPVCLLVGARCACPFRRRPESRVNLRYSGIYHIITRIKARLRWIPAWAGMIRKFATRSFQTLGCLQLETFSTPSFTANYRLAPCPPVECASLLARLARVHSSFFGDTVLIVNRQKPRRPRRGIQLPALRPAGTRWSAYHRDLKVANPARVAGRAARRRTSAGAE